MKVYHPAETGLLTLWPIGLPAPPQIVIGIDYLISDARTVIQIEAHSIHIHLDQEVLFLIPQ